jgi:hypothetical protein
MFRYLLSLFCKKRKHGSDPQASASKRLKFNASTHTANTEEEASSTDIPYSKHLIGGFLNITRITHQGENSTLYGLFIIDKVSIRWICTGN